MQSKSDRDLLLEMERTRAENRFALFLNPLRASA
ncbi:hypothetical protein M728_003384 [Ensifer sp. WSM1721]